MDKIAHIFRKIALWLALFLPLYFAVAALGTKFGWWDWKLGFVKLAAIYGPKLLLLTTGIALIALLLSLFAKPRRGIITSLLCLAVPIAGIAYGKSVRGRAKSLPFIHEISTDTQNPPAFSEAIIKLRTNCSNRLNEYDANVIKAQKQGYPDIQTLKSNMPPKEMFDKTQSVIRSLGWDIVSEDKASGHIEARTKSFWFGFPDDVAVRILPSENGSKIDIRSLSCHGKSDIGANAARIRMLSRKLGTPK